MLDSIAEAKALIETGEDIEAVLIALVAKAINRGREVFGAQKMSEDILLNKIKEVCETDLKQGKEILDAYESDDFAADDWAAGNVDDAFYTGMNCGAATLASYILQLLPAPPETKEG